jgi:hypothetical protein
MAYIQNRYLEEEEDQISLKHPYLPNKRYGVISRKTLTVTTHSFNPLNAELNPICHLLALLGANHILHFSRIRVNLASMCRWVNALIL